MARKKIKDWTTSSYSLGNDEKKILKQIAEFQGLSQSDMIGFMARNYDAGINPSNKLGILLEERKLAKKRLGEIDDKIEKLTEQIKIFEIWKTKKNQNKGVAIRILKRKILDREYGEAEIVAKYWQGKTGITALELIAEASEIIQRTGI